MKKKKIILVLASAIVVSALVTLGVGGTLFLRDRRIDAAGHQMFSCIVDGNAEQLWSLMTPKMQQSFASRHGGHEGALRHIRASSGTWDDLVGFIVVWRLVFGDEATVTIQTERPGALGNLKSQFFIQMKQREGAWLMRGCRPQ